MPVRTLPMLAVLAILGAGCTSHKSGWVAIEELKAPKKPGVRATHPGVTGPGVSRDLRTRGRPAAESGSRLGVDGRPVTDKISRRIAEDRSDWEEYRTEASVQSGAHASGLADGASVEEKPTAADKHDTGLIVSPAVRRRHSAEYVNLQLRIAVLESRVTSLDGTERKEAAVKLEQARAELRAVDEACAEETQAAKNAEPSSGGAIVQPAVLK